ncbi:MAG: DUF4194 domain-containing protein [Blastochloris sp.]|nr:DUF4194 domain-containing protein [Blastochloris sp.]
MSDVTPRLQPEPYAPALIRLLQGFVYDDDTEAWELLLRYQQAVEDYFGRMGLAVYVNEGDGFAYLSQPPDIEDERGAAIVLPRLTRRRALTYSVTLVLVVLREELNQFDSTNIDSVRLVIPRARLFEMLRPFYGQRDDERALLEQLIGRGLVDVARQIDPHNSGLFTWWAPWRNMRQRNIGWRIDYILASAHLMPRVRACTVLSDVGSSDHAPVLLTLDDAATAAEFS